MITLAVQVHYFAQRYSRSTLNEIHASDLLVTNPLLYPPPQKKSCRNKAVLKFILNKMYLIHKCYIQNIFRQNLQLFILILESEFLEVPSSTYLPYLTLFLAVKCIPGYCLNSLAQIRGCLCVRQKTTQQIQNFQLTSD